MSMSSLMPVSAGATTEQLLQTGGDARIRLDPVLGKNKYSCAPHPEPEIAAFGSSTASSISTLGFEAADILRGRIATDLRTASAPAVYARELSRIRAELLRLCNLENLNGLEMIFSSSGTDAHLLATQLAAAEGETTSTLVIMMEADETGKGVPSALNGKHFSSQTALGGAFPEGEPLADAKPVVVAVVAIRDGDGSPRHRADVDREVEHLAAAAAERGQRVLLVLLDQSKSGLLAPSPDCALMLRDRFPGTVDILIDACQFRLAPATLRRYLELGFMVTVTGSKFLTGPAFSGALFVPAELSPRLGRCRLPVTLAAYSACAEWPQRWAAQETLHDVANFGLLLRWEAALAELRAFRAVPETLVTKFLTELATAVQARLTVDPAFELLPGPPLDRSALGAPATWDSIPSIFPFLLCRAKSTAAGGASTPLNRDETMAVYRLLQNDLSETGNGPEQQGKAHTSGLRCQLGQPVDCGVRNGIPISALRLCTSSRLVVEAAATGSTGSVLQRMLTALDKAAWLVNSVVSP